MSGERGCGTFEWLSLLVPMADLRGDYARLGQVEPELPARRTIGSESGRAERIETLQAGRRTQTGETRGQGGLLQFLPQRVPGGPISKE